MKTLIIGSGVVGSNIAKELVAAKIYPAIHDPAKAVFADKTDWFEYAFVCVPTDCLSDGTADTSIVRAVIAEWKESVDTFIIKSTVPPGTTADIVRSEHVRAVFSPEYYGGTQHANTPHPFVIIGTDNAYAGQLVAELYKEMLTGYARIMKTDSKTAELVKYAENTWLAMQVTFFNQFARIAGRLGIDIDVFREALLLDERIARSHSFTYREHPYYDSHCLNKDLPALLAFCNDQGMDAAFVERIIQTNTEYRDDIHSFL